MGRHLSCFALLLLASAAAAATPDVPRLLQEHPADRPLQINLDDGSMLSGLLSRVTADSLYLADGAGACALAEIVRLRERRSAAGRGATYGSVAGGFAGALLGLATGAYAASFAGADEGYREVTAIVGFTVMGVGAGIAAGALVGAGFGALGSAWYDLYPVCDLPPVEPPRGARLGVRAGLSTADDFAGRAYESGYLGVALPRRSGHTFEPAAELGWFNLGMAQQVPDGRLVQVEDTLLAGVAVRVGPVTRGLAPFGSAGAAYYVRNSGWFGVNLGGGLRWRGARGRDIDLEVRWHSGSSGPDDHPGSAMVSVAAGWTFGI